MGEAQPVVGRNSSLLFALLDVEMFPEEEQGSLER